MFCPEVDDAAVDYTLKFNKATTDTNSERVVENENAKRKLDEVNSLIDREDNVSNVKKCKYEEEELDLACEWDSCNFNAKLWSDFSKHVRAHIEQVIIKESEAGETVFYCSWSDCAFETANSIEMVRHVNYHSVHTKLKNIGLNLIQKQKLKACVFDTSQRNLVQDLSDPLKCKWAGCTASEFEHPQEYYQHVARHKDDGDLACLWADCTKKNLASATRLREHLRSHTQEKQLACPTCGGLFASRVKLFDHLKRQQGGAEAADGFTCTHCNKKFALERLLRDHMRSLMNHMKCEVCGLGWPNLASLNIHIKYKHSQVRNYPCDMCDMKCKSPQDLKQHMRTHQGDVLKCIYDCGFICKSNTVMKNHLLRVHFKSGSTFACHICDSKYKRGAYLTNHLKKKHHVTTTASRFRYKLDESTGFYKAQLIRLELDELEEMKENVAGSADEAEDDPLADVTSDGSLSSSVSKLEASEMQEQQHFPLNLSQRPVLVHSPPPSQPPVKSPPLHQKQVPYSQASVDGHVLFSSSPVKQSPINNRSPFKLTQAATAALLPAVTAPDDIDGEEHIVIFLEGSDRELLEMGINPSRDGGHSIEDQPPLRIVESNLVEVDITQEQFKSAAEVTAAELHVPPAAEETAATSHLNYVYPTQESSLELIGANLTII